MDQRALILVSQTVVDELANSIEANLERYVTEGFEDLASGNGWMLEAHQAKWDQALLDDLDTSGGSAAEVHNSLLIYEGLRGMTPALAREERLWVRMCHVEGLDFARSRWLEGSSDVAGEVKRHFFAPGFPASRDDNVFGRLWWNGHIASLGCPGDIKRGLELLLSRANIRLQLVDRADTAFREPLVQGIFRLLDHEFFASYDAAIADFMFEVNKRSGGIVFEALEPDSIDEHLSGCLVAAKERRAMT